MTHWAIDLDDVVVDFVPGMLHSYELEFGEAIDYSDGTWGPRMVKFMHGTPALHAAGYKSAWDWLRDREWLWALFPAVQGAVGGVATLRANGNWVEAVTSKPGWARHNVYKWLGKWRVDFDQVTIVSPGDEKRDFTNAAVIVDDKWETCNHFAGDALRDRKSIWFNRYECEGPSGFIKHCAHNWGQVLDIAREWGDVK